MSPSATNVEMSDLLQLTVDEGASDLHIRVGIPPMLRIHGALTPLDLPPLTPEDTERMMKSITSSDHQQHVREHGGTDFGLGFGLEQVADKIRADKTRAAGYEDILHQNFSLFGVVESKIS